MASFAPPLARFKAVVPARPVLLVDADPDARNILRHLLEHSGYEAIEAVDQDAALAIARERNVGLIVTELFVARGDEVSCFVESVRADGKLADIPVLIVTTQAYGADKLRARRAGSAGYIVKPFAATDVLAEVARLVVEADA